MAFPTSPTNGQITVVNNVSYQYSNVSNAWTRILSTANIITANTIAVNGTLSAAGNITTGNYFIGNGSLLTGISTNPAAITNGTSNVSVVSSGGNVTVGIGGTSNIAIFATSGEYITGLLSVSGNILTAGAISATGTLSVTGATTLGTASTGNLAAGNVTTGGIVSAAGNVTGGNLLTGGLISATGTITGSSHLGAVVSVTANVTGGNLLTGGLISATGAINSDANIVAGTNTKAAPALFYTNSANTQYGALLMQKAGVERWLIGSDNSTGNGNVVVRFNASTNYLTVTEAGAVIITGNVTGGNLLTGGLISATGNLTVGNISTTIANVTTFNSAQGGNVTGTLIATSANAQFFNQTNGAGYVTVAGYLSAAGNITGGNILTGGLISVTGNATVGNISATNYTGTTVSVTGNVTSGNILTGGSITSTGNIQGGNIRTVGLVSATGNVIGANFVGNANIQFTPSTTPPTSGNLIGAQWYDTSTDTLYEYQSDGTSLYWIDISSAAFGSSGAATGTYLQNGTSNVAIASNSNVTIGIGGATIQTVASTGVYTTGVESVTGNITGGNIATAGLITATGNITAVANIAGGNIKTVGIISSTGTITSQGATNSTAFAVGNSAVSNVALGFFPTAGTPAEMAIRDYSTVASTFYFDNSVGSANVNGSFQFRGSNAFTQWAKIDQYGVTVPTRPAFRVYGNTSTNFTTGTTLTNQVIDYNQGSNYVNSTGIFTAPVAGLYSVWLNARAGATASLSQIGVFKNNDTSGSNVVCFWEITTSATQTTHFGVSSVTKLAVGDTLRAKVVAGGVNFDNNDNWGAAFIG